MATTTNYGWTTPDDTALVKDGASAIRTLGTAIDTTTFNNAAAAIAKTIVDAKGDIIAATGADAVTRVAVGTNGQYLKADSTASGGVSWDTLPASGGMTLLSTTSLSGATVNITSISQSYKNLIVMVQGAYVASGSPIRVRVNNDSATNYGRFYHETGGTGTGGTGLGQMDFVDLGTTATFGSSAGVVYITIPRYTEAHYKSFPYWATGGNIGRTGMFLWNSTSAINEINFFTNGTTFSGGTVYIYGAN